MLFHPRMQSSTEGITILGDLQWRAWNGMIADVWNVACDRDARGEYVSEAPRLVVVLDQVGEGGLHLMAAPGRDGGRLGRREPLSYVPAGLRVWSRTENIRRLTHLDLHFDMTVLGSRFMEGMDLQGLDRPRLTFADDRLLSLARLIAAECNASGNLHDLYGESLMAALFVGLLQTEPRIDRRKAQLPPRQLRRVIDYIEEHCSRPIRLHELAELTGLSTTYFCCAFKESTGVPPHKWQMRARVERAKALLTGSAPGMTLAAAAAAAGFSDQAHLTRVFRRIVGTTPAAWLRDGGA
ncbi:helix-turn-helix domain-containing protein [Azospirillum agricola]|uniref:helix-turn-helix domain-containing protein n=1 Tax=Azospirillum agricola TaxID=1720247 RepID=UPI000A0F0E04|nr:AraC family transcriptional regulator [Azospirillum agricola]SMH62930.1 transcriptional regulator, AraC family [Azospirillum lipoferum]